MAEIEAIGSGRHRSRGCFWLASRPDQVCAWEGSGGHLNIGVVDEWTDGPPFSRLVIVGDWSDLEVNQLAVRGRTRPRLARSRGRLRARARPDRTRRRAAAIAHRSALTTGTRRP